MGLEKNAADIGIQAVVGRRTHIPWQASCDVIVLVHCQVWHAHECVVSDGVCQHNLTINRDYYEVGGAFERS